MDHSGHRTARGRWARLARRATVSVAVLSALLVAGAAASLGPLAGASRSARAPHQVGAQLLASMQRAAPSAVSRAVVGTAVTAVPPPDASGLTAADRAAGLLATRIPQRGGGRLDVVPGSSPAPGSGPVKRVRVEVEAGLDVDGAAFADFVLDTLNDPRGWGHGGRMTFARTAGTADLRVVLASPQTSAALCAPLVTHGTLSCGIGSTAVLTLYRWVRATPDYGSDRTGYRRYLVNHEVGHTLGHGHQQCPGRGSPAPVMMQQTKGLLGCLPNSWPYP